MEENYILFETAKLAKEKGFNEPTFCGYKENYGKNYKGESINPYLIKYNLKLFNNKKSFNTQVKSAYENIDK